MQNLEEGPTVDSPIPPGAMIYCPGCGTGLYEVVSPITPDNIRDVSNMVPTTEHEVNRYPFDCLECGRLIVSPSGTFQYAVLR